MKTLIFSLILAVSSLGIAFESNVKYACIGLDNHKDILNPLYLTPETQPTEIGTVNGLIVKFSIQNGEIVLTVALDKQHNKYVYIGATSGGVIRYVTSDINIECLPVSGQ